MGDSEMDGATSGSDRSVASVTGGSSNKVTSASPFTVNVLCIIGATVGLAAIALPWRWTSAGLWYDESTLGAQIWTTTYLTSVKIDYDTLTQFVLLGIGALLAFVTPLGVIPQSAGIAMFYIDELDRQVLYREHGLYEGGFGIGFFLACLSLVLVLASLIKPLGIGYNGGTLPWMRRLKVWSKPRGKFCIDKTVRAIEQYRSWFFSWLVAAIVLLALVAVVDYPYHGNEPLSKVEGGVMWVVDPSLSIYSKWNRSSLQVNDSVNSVGWSTESESLTNGVWASQDFGFRNLSGLLLELTVIDWNGDGVMYPGDCVLITTINGTSFAEGVEYKILYSYPIAIDMGGFVHRHSVITFEFQNGVLHSHGTVEPRGLILIM